MTVLLLYMSDGVIDLFIGNLNQVLIKYLYGQAGRGYSWFHGWLANRIGVCGLEPIWDYLTELETEEFPYQTCYLRYTVHGDNRPSRSINV